MGTHPIFESDFDCLTEQLNRSKNAVLFDGDSQGELDRLFDFVPPVLRPAKRGPFEDRHRLFLRKLSLARRVKDSRFGLAAVAQGDFDGEKVTKAAICVDVARGG